MDWFCSPIYIYNWSKLYLTLIVDGKMDTEAITDRAAAFSNKKHVMLDPYMGK